MWRFSYAVWESSPSRLSLTFMLLSAERDFVMVGCCVPEGAGKFGRSESVADFLADMEQLGGGNVVFS